MKSWLCDVRPLTFGLLALIATTAGCEKNNNIRLGERDDDDPPSEGGFGGEGGKTETATGGEGPGFVCDLEGYECLTESSRRRCKEDRSGYEESECEADLPVCLMGECVVCDPGTQRCDSNAAALCNELGSAWELTECKGEAPYCVDGACEPSRALQVTAGEDHTCARLEIGSVQCWGRDRYLQLGDDGEAVDRFAPTDVVELSDVIDLDAGGSASCAVLTSGKVKCWGRNSKGTLGNGDTTETPQFTPEEVIGLSNVTSVSVGDSHACALLDDGKVKCWGDNSGGQLGNNGDINGPPSYSPEDTFGLENAEQIGTGNFFSCALIADGTVQCWGYDNRGQLGNGDSMGNSNVPLEVIARGGSALTGVASIAVGGDHACALMDGGNVKCWGSDDSGQIGDGDGVLSKDHPIDVPRLSDVVSISAGWAHTCAVHNNGTISCWGDNFFGMLGIGADNEVKPLPETVHGITNAVAVSCGQAHTCALLEGGSLKCWGYDNYGAVGDGPMTQDTTVPVDVYSF